LKRSGNLILGNNVVQLCGVVAIGSIVVTSQLSDKGRRRGLEAFFIVSIFCFTLVALKFQLLVSYENPWPKRGKAHFRFEIYPSVHKELLPVMPQFTESFALNSCGSLIHALHSVHMLDWVVQRLKIMKTHGLQLMLQAAL
jgi:hypothetical protein